MKLTKCENKHFYDSDKYDVCPHCKKETVDASVAEAHKMDRPGIGLGPSSEPKAESKEVDTLSPHTGSIWNQSEDKKTVGFMDEFANSGKNLASETIDAEFSAAVDIHHDESPLVTNYRSDEHIEPGDTKIEHTATLSSDVANTADKTGSTNSKATSTVPVSPVPSLQSQVNAVTVHGSTEDVKTVAFYDFADTEPVVGWLVCVKGEYFGYSFNLKAGQNFIGRAMNMDVPLAKDTSVSRNRHAIITYDPLNRLFFIQPGESNGLTYLNDNLLLTHQPIKPYEKIRVGNSELIFVPCCGEQFAWEDYIT